MHIELKAESESDGVIYMCQHFLISCDATIGTQIRKWLERKKEFFAFVSH
jgi:hypothetical protein